eukprot:Gb_03714 [translate_table: standard]
MHEKAKEELGITIRHHYYHNYQATKRKLKQERQSSWRPITGAFNGCSCCRDLSHLHNRWSRETLWVALLIGVVPLVGEMMHGLGGLEFELTGKEETKEYQAKNVVEGPSGDDGDCAGSKVGGRARVGWSAWRVSLVAEAKVFVHGRDKGVGCGGCAMWLRKQS